MPATDSPDWFGAIAEARRHELKGWCKVAALLWAAEFQDEWWSPQYESKRDALAQPEIQLSPSTAKQYIDVWEVFRNEPIGELERCRPRLLHQAVKTLKNEPHRAAEALSDAQVLSWSSFRSKWNATYEHESKPSVLY